MFLHICLSLFLLPPALCSVNAGRIARNRDLDAVSPQKRALPILQNSASLDMFNTSATDVHLVGMPLTIKCEGHYGTGLEAQSCFSALDQSPTGTVQESWSFDPALHPDVLLPVALWSGKH